MATCQCSYEQLVQMHPEVDDYKLYYAQVCSEWLVHVHVYVGLSFHGVHYSFFFGTVSAQSLLLS